MLGHLSVGVRDLARSTAFQDAVLGAMGFVRVWTGERGVGYAEPGGGDKLNLFAAPAARAPGDGFHYAAFVIDPDGYKLEAVHQQARREGRMSQAEPWKTLPPPDPLPAERLEGRVTRDGASIWFASFGEGPPLILLHGGDASSDLWGGQVPAFVAAGWRVVTIDSRGHGRSTRDHRPLHYTQMADDVVAVMDAAGIDRAAVVGWSDGAIVGLILAMAHPERLTRVFAFGANMDLAGLNPAGVFSPLLPKAEALLAANYARLSETPHAYHAFARWVLAMQLSEPNYTAADLAAIQGPAIAIADGDHEEVIRRAHTLYLARTIPGAQLVMLPGVSHFAPLQDPAGFNRAVLDFLGR